jgi:hypothetical protein
LPIAIWFCKKNARLRPAMNALGIHIVTLKGDGTEWNSRYFFAIEVRRKIPFCGKTLQAHKEAEGWKAEEKIQLPD